MKYNKYNEYKYSGTKWFEEIPSNWDVRPIKHLANTIPGGTPSTSNLEYWENGSIPWLPSGMVQNCQINNEDAYKFITEKGLLNSATKYIGPNSILVALTGATCANIGYLTFKATANQSVISVEPYTSIPKYVYYALLSQREQILDKKTGGAQSGINEEDVKNILIPMMNIQEQKQIANYLDQQTGKINETIAKNKELIQLLEEKRVSLINQVVTKGLNPNVSMKDSGIEWIGEIPEHWDVNRLKFLISKKAQYGANCEPEPNENKFNYRYIRITDITENASLKNDFVYLSKENAKGFVLKEGDILFARSGATVGKTYLYTSNDGDCCFAGYLIRYVTNKKLLNPKYLLYFSFSRSYIEWIKLVSTQATIQNVSADKYDNLILPVPTIKEQNEIVLYLDNEFSRINKIISKVKGNINLLEEYKTSLIHHVVTGKIDVKGEEV